MRKRKSVVQNENEPVPDFVRKNEVKIEVSRYVFMCFARRSTCVLAVAELKWRNDF